MARVVAAGGGVVTVVMGCVGRVDRWFFRTWSRWPLIIGTEAGGYFLSSAEVISGRDERKPESRALLMVEMEGEPIAACRKAIRWEMVAWGVKGTATYAVFCSSLAAKAYLDCVGGDMDERGSWMRHRGDSGVL